jgi:hypothetical protein
LRHCEPQVKQSSVLKMRKKDAGLLHLRFAKTGFEIVPTP